MVVTIIIILEFYIMTIMLSMLTKMMAMLEMGMGQLQWRLMSGSSVGIVFCPVTLLSCHSDSLADLTKLASPNVTWSYVTRSRG